MPRRYEQLVSLIRRLRPERIVEVGTYRGDTAVLMLTEAARWKTQLEYGGYDLFEDGDAHARAVEFHGKAEPASHDLAHARLSFLRDKLKAHGVTLRFAFATGDTRLTLKYGGPKFDFAFIDGGHSIETIDNDWKALRAQGPAIVLDDYYLADEDGACPDTTRFGCNRLVASLGNQAVLLPVRDRVAGGGYCHMVLAKAPTRMPAA